MTVEVGQTYRSTLEVRGEDGALANPATATYTVTLPDLTTATAPVTLPPAVMGHLIADYVTTVAGPHRGKWVTTAPAIPKTDWFQVIEFRSILSLDDGREFLGILDMSRDELLRSRMAGITRLFERHIGTCLPKTVTAEFIPGDVTDRIRLPSAPIPSTSAVTTVASVWADGPSWAAADLIVLDPHAGTVARADQQPFYGGPWRWTGTAGRLVIPGDVTEGFKEALWDLWATQRGVSADTVEPSLGEVSDYETALPAGWRLPPRVMQLIDGERLITGFA